MVDDKVGLVVFAGDAFTQLPITCDYVSAKMFLHTITPNLIPTQGTAIGAALQTAITSFGAQESDAGRAIILITDGENHEDDPVAMAQYASELGVRVFTIGVGSVEGKIIPLPGGGYITDKDGNNVMTRLDEATLQSIAEAGKGVYVKAGNREFGLTPVIEEIQRMDDEVFNTITYAEYEELYMYFLAVAVFFLVLEMLIGDRRSKVHLFKKQ